LVEPQDPETRHAEEGEHGQVDSSLASLVADETDQDRDGTGRHVDWHGVELCPRGGPAEIEKDGGHEDGETLHRDVDAEEAGGADVVVDVE